MVGRGALADPWIFSGERPTASDAARFLLDYAAELLLDCPASPRGAAGRVKQLLRHWTAGGLVGEDRESWMRESDPARLFERLSSIAGDERDPRLNPVLDDRRPNRAEAPQRKKSCRWDPAEGSDT
jgi:hypothetical protein